MLLQDQFAIDRAGPFAYNRWDRPGVGPCSGAVPAARSAAAGAAVRPRPLPLNGARVAMGSPSRRRHGVALASDAR
jgi:hypothetical protein